MKTVDKEAKNLPAPETAEFDHVRMHVEHQTWMNGTAFWHDEVKIWQDELKKAIAGLAKIEETLRSHEKALQTHAGSLRLYQQEFAALERALAGYERGADTALTSLAEAHEKEQGDYRRLEKIHEELKRRQHSLLAQCLMLVKAIGGEKA